MKFVFKKYNDDDNEYDISEICHTIEAESLDEILPEFELFLLGCGFRPKGPIEIRDDGDDEGI